MDSDQDQVLTKLCRTMDIADGEMRQVEIDGIGKLAVYRVADLFYVSDDFCTHAEASLSEEGYLEGFIINCSWHSGAFDIRTGEPTALPCTEPLKTYPVVLVDDMICVRL